jgi:nucleotide-binding universal stress UspA family protein
MANVNRRSRNQGFAMATLKRILAAVDQSPSALRIAQAAADLAHQVGADLTLLTIVNSPEGPNPALDDYILHEHIHDTPAALVRTAAAGELERLAQQVAVAQRPKTSCVVLCGNPPAGILALADELHADMIVIGHRSRAGFGWLVGSVARQVIEHATCPVLVAR